MRAEPDEVAFVRQGHEHGLGVGVFVEATLERDAPLLHLEGVPLGGRALPEEELAGLRVANLDALGERAERAGVEGVEGRVRTQTRRDGGQHPRGDHADDATKEGHAELWVSRVRAPRPRTPERRSLQ